MTIIFSPSNSPTFNLAAEEYLFSQSQDELLFLYVNEPSVIIGCNQVVRNEVNSEFCAENDIKIVRRISGGGAVYHDLGNLNYCFISNTSTEKSSLSADFLEPIIQTMKFFNIPLENGKRKDLWLPCGFKVSGTASHISKKRELHHGTLLYDSDLVKLQKALLVNEKNSTLKGIASVPAIVNNIRTFLFEQGLNAPNADIFFDNFYCKIKEMLMCNKILALNYNEISCITNLQETKYRDTTWTFKK